MILQDVIASLLNRLGHGQQSDTISQEEIQHWPSPALALLLEEKLIATAALWREESRGGHFRSDFPLSDDSRIPVHSAQQIGKPIAGISRD